MLRKETRAKASGPLGEPSPLPLKVRVYKTVVDLLPERATARVATAVEALKQIQSYECTHSISSATGLNRIPTEE